MEEKENVLTETQKEVYIAIQKFIKENGYSPTVREICNLTFRNSSATIQSFLRILKRKGYITYVPKLSRTIKILKEE